VLVDDELEIRAPAEGTVEPDKPQVTVAIRPEKMSVHIKPPDQRAVPGVIEEVIYTGTDTRYLVRLTENTIVTVREQNVGVGTSASFGCISPGSQSRPGCSRRRRRQWQHNPFDKTWTSLRAKSQVKPPREGRAPGERPGALCL